MSGWLHRLRRRLTEARTRRRAPWPIVWECEGLAGSVAHGPGERTCPQCDGSHAHMWVAGPSNPGPVGGPGTPVRCRVCGARKCDVPGCIGKRHHRDAHIYGDGTIERVSA